MYGPSVRKPHSSILEYRRIIIRIYQSPDLDDTKTGELDSIAPAVDVCTVERSVCAIERSI